MLTVPQAATRLRKNPETIRRWIRSGRLRARKVGTQHMIEEQELGAMIASDRLALPEGWTRTVTGEPMPDALAALRRSRSGR